MNHENVLIQSQAQDWIWMENFRNGDESAFHQIFKKYKSFLINLAYRFVQNKQAAEDVAQDVFIKVYEKKAPINRGAKFSTWLYRVAVNTALDCARRKKFSAYSLNEPVGDGRADVPTFLERVEDKKSLSPGRKMEEEDLKKLVQEEIQGLPEHLRTPILLYQFQDLSYREIAQILGTTEKTVEKRLYHAKERLRKTLAKYFNLL